MSFDATCSCPNCGEFWYECANENETFTCPKCGYRDIEPEELDSFCLDMDEEEELAIMEYFKKPELSYFKKKKEKRIETLKN